MTFFDICNLIRSIPKTLRFNFHYFPFKTAIKLPVIVSHRVVIRRLGGKVNISATPKMAMIKIGFGDVGHYDRVRSHSIWQVSGEVNFLGNTIIGHGSKISCRGRLTLGNKFNITAESTIVCANEITFGENCLLSWDIMVMDTDEHPVFNETNIRINPDKPIIVGKNVWIGCKSILLKGTKIPDNTVVAASTMIRSAFHGENQIIGGNPATILKKGIHWEDK